MWPVIYVLGVLVAAFLCGWQIRSAEEPIARWMAIMITVLWPVWFVMAWITVTMIMVPSMVISRCRKNARMKAGG